MLVNPGSGRGRTGGRLEELRRLAVRAGAELHLSRDARDLTVQARRAAADGVARLLVAGGDGTVHHALQGLAGSDCALAVLPLGSGNDFASTLGMPGDLDQALESALAGTVRRVDLVRLSVAGEEGGKDTAAAESSGPLEGGPETARGEDGMVSPVSCLYAGVAGVGFDSAANETANRVQRLRGGLIYLYAVLHTLATFRPPVLRVEYEGGRFEGPAMLAALANTPRYGGGMRVAPGARLDDGLLDLVIVRAVPRATFLRVFPRVYRGEHMSHPAVFHARTPWATVKLDRPMAVYGDGERLLPVGEDGVRFEVVPGALEVVGG